MRSWVTQGADVAHGRELTEAQGALSSQTGPWTLPRICLHPWCSRCAQAGKAAIHKQV